MYLYLQMALALKNGQPVVIDLTDVQINNIAPFMDYLSSVSVLGFQKVGNTKMTPGGVFYDCRITQMSEFQKTVSDSQFNY